MDDEPLPSAGNAWVRLVAATPEAARDVVEVGVAHTAESWPASSESAEPQNADEV